MSPNHICSDHAVFSVNRMKNRAFHLAGLLIAIAFIVVAYRVGWLNYPLFPKPSVKAWQITLNVQVRPAKPDSPVSLRIALPKNNRNRIVIDERIMAGGLNTNVVNEDGMRMGIWSGMVEGNEDFVRYEATIVQSRRTPDEVEPSHGSPLMELPDLEDTDTLLLNHVAANIRALHADARIQALAAAKQGRWGLQRDSSDTLAAWAAFQQKHGSVNSLLYLLKSSGLPFRQTQGLLLSSDEGVVTEPLRWIEVRNGKTWLALDPMTWARYSPSAALLPLAYGNVQSIGIANGMISDLRWTSTKNVVSPWRIHMTSVMNTDSILNRWSLFSLPQEFQTTVRVFLLVPIGALIVCVLRNVVGFPTFGIFMPVLMALAFRNTGLAYGLAIFGGIVFLGYAVRRWMNSFRLLLVPRLSAILTIVVLVLAMLALIGNHFGFRGMMAIGLLPIVILTMTIERFYVLIEESGVRQAFITVAGSTAVAAVTYWILDLEWLQLQFFVFPELLLAVAGLQIMLGRYTGYRLSEYFRFRALKKTS